MTTALLVLTGFLLVASGGVKVARAAKVGQLALAVVSAGEMVVGIGLAATAFVRPPTAEGGLRLIGGGVGLLLVSSVWYGYRMHALRKEREASEGARLVTYVKYLAESDTPDR